VDAKNIGYRRAGIIEGQGKELLAGCAEPIGKTPFLIRLCAVRTSQEGYSTARRRRVDSASFQCRNVTADGVTSESWTPEHDGFDIGFMQKGSPTATLTSARCALHQGDKPPSFSKISCERCRLKSDCGAISRHGIAWATSMTSYLRLLKSGIPTRRYQALFNGRSPSQNVSNHRITMDNVTATYFVRLASRLKTSGRRPAKAGRIHM